VRAMQSGTICRVDSCFPSTLSSESCREEVPSGKWQLSQCSRLGGLLQCKLLKVIGTCVLRKIFPMMMRGSQWMHTIGFPDQNLDLLKFQCTWGTPLRASLLCPLSRRVSTL